MLLLQSHSKLNLLPFGGEKIVEAESVRLSIFMQLASQPKNYALSACFSFHILTIVENTVVILINATKQF